MCSAEIFTDWIVAIGTIVLATVAIFQKTIRGWFYKPNLIFSIETEPPDCVSVPFTKLNGTFISDSIYLRLWVKNRGNISAANVEVYGNELRRKRADGNLERVRAFPPMNFKWSNFGKIYFPSIAPKMGKHCDIGHITDPERRHLLKEDSPKLGLTNKQASLAFDLMAIPNHRGHIIGPGEYQLDIIVAAENARPKEGTVNISIVGPWYSDESQMLSDGVGISVATA